MENWKDIKGYEGLYQVSDLANIKSLDRTMILPTGGLLHLKEKLLKQKKRKRDGYWTVGLSKKSKIFTAKVHRLVAIHFIENPENKPQVDHLFGKDRNAAVDLRWATGSENMQRSFDIGTHVSPACKGERNGNSKLTDDIVREIRLSHPGKSQVELAKEYNVSKVLIGRVVNLKNWTHVS